MSKNFFGIAKTLREMKKGDMVEFPIKAYSSVCSTVARFNVEYRAEGRRYMARSFDLNVLVKRTD